MDTLGTLTETVLEMAKSEPFQKQIRITYTHFPAILTLWAVQMENTLHSIYPNRFVIRVENYDEYLLIHLKKKETKYKKDALWFSRYSKREIGNIEIL